MYQINIIEKTSLGNILPLLKILNPHMEEQIMEDRLEAMEANNYECIGIYDGDVLIGISGIWILHKMYAGKHIEPDNVIILPEYRNRGIGQILLDWVHEYARVQGCLTSEINCFTANHDGYRFWINQGYEIIGFHMIKKL